MIIYLNLFLIFFRIGLIGFGGGYAIMSIIMQESVNLGVSAELFADLVALHLVIPGPIAINAATFAGYFHSGFWGSLVATLGVSAPCYAVVLTVMYFLERFKKSKIMEGVLAGIRPAAIGLIAAAALTIAKGVIIKQDAAAGASVFFEKLFSEPFTAFSPMCLLIFVMSLVSLLKFKLNPILVTVLAGVAGAVLIR